MYVCICHAVTDTDINNAVEGGIDTMKKLSEKLSVGTQCGLCTSCAKSCLNAKLVQISEEQPAVA